MHGEAVAQRFFERKLFWPNKRFAGGLYRFDAGRNKGAHVLAQVIERKEEPFPIDVGQMIGIHQSPFGLLLARLAVTESDLLALRRGLGQRIEYLQVEN